MQGFSHDIDRHDIKMVQQVDARINHHMEGFIHQVHSQIFSQHSAKEELRAALPVQAKGKWTFKRVPWEIQQWSDEDRWFEYRHSCPSTQKRNNHGTIDRQNLLKTAKNLWGFYVNGVKMYKCWWWEALPAVRERRNWHEEKRKERGKTKASNLSDSRTQLQTLPHLQPALPLQPRKKRK